MTMEEREKAILEALESSHFFERYLVDKTEVEQAREYILGYIDSWGSWIWLTHKDENEAEILLNDLRQIRKILMQVGSDT